MPVNWLGLTYNVERSSGQCIIGPPTVLSEPEVTKEIMVSGLPKQFGPEELIPLLSAAGKVYKIRLYQDYSGLNRGYCYVNYFSFESSCNAMTLDGMEVVRGKRLKVVPSKHICSVTMYRIDEAMSEATIREKIEDVTKTTKFNIRIYRIMYGLQKATIDFSSHEEALNAIKALNSFAYVFGQNCKIRLSSARQMRDY